MELIVNNCRCDTAADYGCGFDFHLGIRNIFIFLQSNLAKQSALSSVTQCAISCECVCVCVLKLHSRCQLAICGIHCEAYKKKKRQCLHNKHSENKLSLYNLENLLIYIKY